MNCLAFNRSHDLGRLDYRCGGWEPYRGMVLDVALTPP